MAARTAGSPPLSTQVPGAAAATALLPPPSLRVVIPGYPTPTVTMVPLTPGLRVQGALEFVARRHRLPVFHERFVLRVAAADQVRLGLPTRELPEALNVGPLSLDTVEMVKKAYADSPASEGLGSPVTRAQQQRRRGGSNASAGEVTPGDADTGRDPLPSDVFGKAGGRGGALRGPGGSGVPAEAGGVALSKGGRAPGPAYTAATAMAFQEWPVIKTNPRGRRQERVLGIDGTRVTNRKVRPAKSALKSWRCVVTSCVYYMQTEKPRLLASDKTVNGERLLRDLWLVEALSGHPAGFALTFSGEGTTPKELNVRARGSE